MPRLACHVRRFEKLPEGPDPWYHSALGSALLKKTFNSFSRSA